MAAHSHLWPQEIQTTEMYLGSEAVTWFSAANHLEHEASDPLHQFI